MPGNTSECVHCGEIIRQDERFSWYAIDINHDTNPEPLKCREVLSKNMRAHGRHVPATNALARLRSTERQLS